MKEAAEAALLRFDTELRYATVALPKFYVMTVNEVVSVFLRGVIIGTKKFDRSNEVAIYTNDIGSILRHLVARRRDAKRPI